MEPPLSFDVTLNSSIERYHHLAPDEFWPPVFSVYLSWMHSGERLNKLSVQFMEYAASRHNGENGPFLELELFSNSNIIRPTEVIFDQKILHRLLTTNKMNFIIIQLAEITRFIELVPTLGAETFNILSERIYDSQLIVQNWSSKRQPRSVIGTTCLRQSAVTQKWSSERHA